MGEYMATEGGFTVTKGENVITVKCALCGMDKKDWDGYSLRDHILYECEHDHGGGF